MEDSVLVSNVAPVPLRLVCFFFQKVAAAMGPSEEGPNRLQDVGGAFGPPKSWAGALSPLLTRQGLSKGTVDILLQSWRASTGKQYLSYLKRWFLHCSRAGFNPSHFDVSRVLDFLYALSVDHSVATVGVAKAALAAWFGAVDPSLPPLGDMGLIKRFMRGLFLSKPPRPSRPYVWDVGVVLSYIESLGPNDGLSLVALSEKTAMLMALSTACRQQLLYSLRLADMDISFRNGSVCDKSFVYGFHTKTTRPGFHPKGHVLFPLPDSPNTCVVRSVVDYFFRTTSLRGHEEQFFVSSTPPHKGVSRDTIRRWLIGVLRKSGIDVSVFTAHSTRSAASSHAFAGGLPVDEVLQMAGWSSAQTFLPVLL